MTIADINLKINPERFRKDFNVLSQIGADSQNGISRPAFSPAHQEARNWFRARILDAGLQFKTDEAGNQSGFLECGLNNAPTFLLGSHLDSVIHGGKYDGALGVIAGLEILRRVKETGLALPFNLEVIDFTDEEGTLVSFLGSFAFTGKLTRKQLQNPRGGKEALEVGLSKAGLTMENLLKARRDMQTIAGYLELHIEQGPLLEQNNAQIGIVDRISGIAFYRLSYLGKAEHAGTASMQNRRDAALGASAFTLAAREIILEQFPDCYSNVGYVKYQPGLFNVVPEKATLTLEFRSADKKEFRRIHTEMINKSKSIAKKFNLGIEIEFLGEREPVELNATFRKEIHNGAQLLNLKSMPITSRAGHDAQTMASFVPTGLIFIHSVKGISHSPEEFTPWEDCINGANVLLQTVLRLSNKYTDFDEKK